MLGSPPVVGEAFLKPRRRVDFSLSLAQHRAAVHIKEEEVTMNLKKLLAATILVLSPLVMTGVSLMIPTLLMVLGLMLLQGPDLATRLRGIALLAFVRDILLSFRIDPVILLGDAVVLF
jgi:hypothetical protein